jgi:demethylmenaquinone methyltransferase/2-methoxy-6-polyprenyl-1,4-benzoquinol methylase
MIKNINKKRTSKRNHIDNQASTPSRKAVWQIFNNIANRYDLLNHLLSFGQDMIWRRKIGNYLPPADDLMILDLATGTADVLLTLNKTGKLDMSFGIDIAQQMLSVGRQKILKKKLDHKIKLFPGDATRIPFKQDCLDIVTIAFGIRNVIDTSRCLKEIYRVLKPDSRVIILEFSIPSNRFIRILYLFYFRHVLPLAGSLVSRDKYAYRYLNKTVETFPYGEKFLNLLQEAGFVDVRAYPLNFGIATMYHGDKK